MKSKFAIGTAALTALVFVVGAAFVGSYLGNQFGQATISQDVPVVLKADSAASGKSLSMATGLVDNDRGVEGLFMLDHLSGNLQCSLISPRTGKVAAVYSANANKDLGLSKGGDADFVMVVGQLNPIGVQRGNVIPASCVCYVGDGNSGKIVGYSFQFNKQLFNRNDVQLQQGALTVLTRGVAREAGMRRDN